MNLYINNLDGFPLVALDALLDAYESVYASVTLTDGQSLEGFLDRADNRTSDCVTTLIVRDPDHSGNKTTVLLDHIATLTID